MNVLLVDDEPTIRKMIKLMLRSGGFQVLDAATAAEALELAANTPIDLLVTDVVLEGMNGSALATALLERHPDLPVLFISGHPMNFETHREWYRRCAFLPKPFQKSELLEAIRELTQAPE